MESCSTSIFYSIISWNPLGSSGFLVPLCYLLLSYVITGNPNNYYGVKWSPIVSLYYLILFYSITYHQMESYGILRNPLKSFEILWNPMTPPIPDPPYMRSYECYGMHGIPRNPVMTILLHIDMTSYGILWNQMGCVGILCYPIVSYGVLWNP